MKNNCRNELSPVDHNEEKDVQTKIIDLFAPTLANFLDVVMEAAENDDWNYGYNLMLTALNSSCELDGKYILDKACPDCNSTISTKINVSRPLFVAAVIHVMKAIMASPGQDIKLDEANMNYSAGFDFDYSNLSCDQCGYSGSVND